MFDHSFRQLPGSLALPSWGPQKAKVRAFASSSNESTANVEVMMFQSGDVSGRHKWIARALRPYL
jgi:hypothetical protein